MAKSPAVMLYTSDFLVEVMDMTMEERGQYITLLCLQHQKGHLSEKTIKACVRTLSPEVREKFEQDENGCWFNRKLAEEIERRNAYSESRSRNRVTASAKNICDSHDTHMKNICASHDEHMENEDEMKMNMNKKMNIETENDTEITEGISSSEQCPVSKIRDLYHEICTSFPRLRSIDGERRKAVAARWRQHKSLEPFEELFRLAESSSFLKGQNDRNWHADFDWMMKANNFSKILERKYNDNSLSSVAGYGNSDAFFQAAVEAGLISREEKSNVCETDTA